MAVHFDPKGESLITDSKSAGLQRWPITPDPETGGLRIGPPQSLGLSARAPFFGNDPDFALSADGRTVAHSPHPGQVLLFDLENPRRKLLIESHALRHAAFSPDGRWLATGNWQGRGAKVWDAQTGKLAHDFDLGEPEEKAAWPAFSPDGKWLVTGTFAEYRFWEVGSWQKKHGLPRENAGQIAWLDRVLARWQDAGGPSQPDGSAAGGSRDRSRIRPLAHRRGPLLLQPRRQPARDLRRKRRRLPGLGPAADPPAAEGDGPRLGPAALPAAAL